MTTGAWPPGPASRRCWLKHEGENPTASFKDRGMTVGVSHARRLGARVVACASTGNTSASLAAYAAAAGHAGAGLRAGGQDVGRQAGQTIAYGARVVQVRGDFDAAMALVQEVAAQRDGVYLLNSVNPFRLEGQKTIVFETLQQLGWQRARLDRAARRQPRQHRRLRQGAGGAARRSA